MNYLLDSLNTHHIEYSDHQLSEYFIQTYFDETDYYFDNRSFPPDFISQNNLRSSLKSLFSSHRHHNLLRVSYLLKESWKKRPAQHTLTSQQFKTLQSLTPSLKMTHYQRFNISFDAIQILKNLFLYLNSDSLVMIYDFGLPCWPEKKLTKKSYLQSYGICTFYAVCFPIIKSLASQHNQQTLCTDHTVGTSQLMLISSPKIICQMTQIFCDSTDSSRKSLSNQFLSKIKHSVSKPRPNTTATIQKQFSNLSYYQKKSFQINITIAELLIQSRHYHDAQIYLDSLIKHYGSFAYSAYYLKAKLYNQLKNYDLTLKLISTLPQKNLNHSGLLYEYCLALIYKQQYKQFEIIFKQFLKETDYFIPWRFFLILAAYYHDTQQHGPLQKLKTWMLITHDQLPTLIQADIIDTIKKM